MIGLFSWFKRWYLELYEIFLDVEYEEMRNKSIGRLNDMFEGRK